MAGSPILARVGCCCGVASWIDYCCLLKKNLLVWLSNVRCFGSGGKRGNKMNGKCGCGGSVRRCRLHMEK